MLYSSAMVPLHPTVSLISCANANWRYQSDNIKRRCLWKCCLNTYLKNFATSPCCHAVITCFFRCLHLLINSDLLPSRLFPSYEFISSFSFKQEALSLTQIIWWTFSSDAPRYFWNKVGSLNFPVLFQQLCVSCAIFMSKGFGVL